MTPLTTITRQFSAALERDRSKLSPEAIRIGEMLEDELQTFARYNRIGPAHDAAMRIIGRRVDAFEKLRQQVRGH